MMRAVDDAFLVLLLSAAKALAADMEITWADLLEEMLAAEVAD